MNGCRSWTLQPRVDSPLRQFEPLLMSIDFESRPHCPITYAALRAAFVTTLDSLLRYSLDPLSDCQRPVEFFDCFPTLRGTAPQVQLECILRTWERWNHGNINVPDLQDDFVFFAAYDTLARMSSERQNHSLQVVLNGPKPLRPIVDQWIVSKTRCLQIGTPGPPQLSLLREVSQFNGRKPSLSSEPAAESDPAWQELLELVGRWAASRDLVLGSTGLLTPEEQDILRAFFEEHPSLVR